MQVWYGDSFGQSYLAGLLPPFKSVSADYAYTELIRPYRIIVSNVDSDFDSIDGINKKDFFIRYNDYESSDINFEFNEVLKKLLTDGEHVSTKDINKDIDFDEIFYGNIIAYEYKFSMPSSYFSKALSHTGNMLTSKFEIFNSVVISPSVTNDEKLTIYFLNYNSNTVYEYALHDYASKEILERLMHEESEKYHTVKYRLTQNGNDFGVFVAKWDTDDVIYYKPIIPSVPYEDNGDLRRSYIERQISFLFNNPSSVSSDDINDVFTYREGNGNSVVKYFSGNVLEYTNYSSRKNEGEGFIFSYSTAIDMLKRDETLLNEYYLSSYEQYGGLWSFYFDLTVNDFPLILSNSVKEGLGISHAIEITVQNGVISKYKRFMYNFTIDTSDYLTATKDYLSAYYEVHGNTSEGVLISADLGYSIDRSSILSTLKLSWFFETGSFDSNGEWVIIPSLYPAK